MNTEQSNLVVAPRIPVTIRTGTPGDIPFIDSLQKMHGKQVGWMPSQQLEGKIKAGHVLVAEGRDEERRDRRDERPEDGSSVSSLISHVSAPLGYVIGNDQYFKRDDVGIIYQLNVAPVHHRSLVGATLIKALFDRAAYGCKLFCCWCAQDIQANHFWESIGFVPLAFRAGSEKKGRVHIFWQKRIRAGDETTPWWFPSKTGGGSIREDRIVLPIPPGTHWSEVRALILPGEDKETRGQADKGREAKALAGPRGKKKAATKRPSVPRLGATFSIPLPGEKPAVALPAPVSKRKVEKKPKRKHDPKLVAAARELRDRWIEHVTANPAALTGAGKYQVSRALPEGEHRARMVLPAA